MRQVRAAVGDSGRFLIYEPIRNEGVYDAGLSAFGARNHLHGRRATQVSAAEYLQAKSVNAPRSKSL